MFDLIKYAVQYVRYGDKYVLCPSHEKQQMRYIRLQHTPLYILQNV